MGSLSWWRTGGPRACATALWLSIGACGPSQPATSPGAGGDASSSATPKSGDAGDGKSAGEAASAASPDASAAGAKSVASAAAAPPSPKVTIVQVDRTKIEGKPPVLSIASPAKNVVIPSAKAAAFEVRVASRGGKPAPGDHLCVALDKRPCRRVDDASKPIPLGELGSLEEGQHVISVLARRASGELLRSGKSAPFASVSFFVGKRVPLVHQDGAPMLLYTAPPKGPAPAEGVLVDFFLANAEVKSGGFVIAATVGGPGIENGVGMLLETDRPLRIQNAQPGEYLSRLTLLELVPDLGESKAVTTVTYQSRPAKGPFAEVERSIFVTK